MAVNYTYCDGCSGAALTVAVNLSEGGLYTTQDGWNGSEYQLTQLLDITVSIGAAISCDLPVRVLQTITYSYYGGGSGSGTYDNYLTLTIPAGQTSKTLTGVLYQNIVTGDQYGDEQSSTYTLVGQASIPSCLQSGSCDLDITGSTVTSPSLLGSTDGSLTVGISGATGSSYTFRLNAGTPQASPTFSGLAAGTYQVRVDEGDCYSQINVTIPNGAFNTGAFTVGEPSSIVASENPIILTLGTALFDGTALFSETNLTIQSGITNNYKMVVTLSSPISYTVTFYAKGFPNKNTYFLANTLTDAQGNFIKNNNNTEIANSLAQVLQDDIIINSNYYINVNSNVVTLVAKTSSSRFDITDSNVTRYNSSNTVVTTGVTVTIIQNGTDRFEGDILENYNIFTEVYGSKNNIEYGSTLSADLFDRQTELQLPYQKSNEMKFNYSDIMKSFVYTPKPDYEFTGFTTLTTYMQPFFFKYGEVYPLIANTNTAKKRLKGSTDYIWVCNAALDWEVANSMTGYTGTTISGYLRNVPFLTNAPNPKYASKRQRELLYFIIPKDLNQGTLSVKGDVVFWDGTALLNQSFITITTGSTNFGGAFCINVSFDRLGLDVIETSNNKLIKQLNIGVYSGTGTTRNLTEMKTFLYDLEEPTNRVGLSWLNKLGTFDSFDFAGVAEEGLDRTAKEYTIARDINFDGSLDFGFKYRANYDVGVTKKLTVNSGWINAETFNWLIELVNSNEVYIYSNEYDNYVRITSFKYTKSSNDTLYNIELELTQTISENNISI